VSADCLKLTIYFGERDRAGAAFLADALVDVFERHAVVTSVLLRGIEGFGIKHHLHTQRLLTLSEDLPLVSVAVDERPRIEALLPEVMELMGDGLVSLERARMLRGGEGGEPRRGEATKLTLYAGRAERSGRRPSHIAAIDLLRERGLAGASVIPGVDGTLHGQRRRARFFSSNAGVPLMLLGLGSPDAVSAALPSLRALFREPVLTLEQVRLCKRDGEVLAEPTHVPERDDAGLPVWQKLMVHASEQATFEGHPLYVQLVRRLREAGAAGATVLRGGMGFYGDQGPFRDRLLALRRRVPVHVVLVDTPPRIRDWWQIVDAVTAESGLVTSELVPAAHAAGPGVRRGGLRLASFAHPRR
jgi:PII-like signaling protein